MDRVGPGDGAQPNLLEVALRRAADDPGYRPAFYRLLLDAAVVAIVETPPPIVDGRLAAGTAVSVRHWRRDDALFIPIFTSLAALQEVVAEEEVFHLSMAARDFFALTRGADLVLNPGLPYGKEFTAAEIEALLDGTLMTPGERWTAERPTQVLIGSPSRQPQTLIEALRSLFARHPEVQAAYLVHIHDPERDDAPHSLVAIECAGDPEPAIGEACLIAGSLPENETNGPVDLMRLGDDGFGQAIREQVEPFYRKPSWVRRLSGGASG